MDNPEGTLFNTEALISYYTSQNISLAKIVLGILLYSQSFNTITRLSQLLGQPFKSSSTYNYKALPIDRANIVYNPSTGSSYSYNIANREIVSFDTIVVVKQKVA